MTNQRNYDGDPDLEHARMIARRDARSAGHPKAPKFARDFDAMPMPPTMPRGCRCMVCTDDRAKAVTGSTIGGKMTTPPRGMTVTGPTESDYNMRRRIFASEVPNGVAAVEPGRTVRDAAFDGTVVRKTLDELNAGGPIKIDRAYADRLRRARDMPQHMTSMRDIERAGFVGNVGKQWSDYGWQPPAVPVSQEVMRSWIEIEAKRVVDELDFDKLLAEHAHERKLALVPKADLDKLDKALPLTSKGTVLQRAELEIVYLQDAPKHAKRIANKRVNEAREALDLERQRASRMADDLGLANSRLKAKRVECDELRDEIARLKGK